MLQLVIDPLVPIKVPVLVQTHMAGGQEIGIGGPGQDGESRFTRGMWAGGAASQVLGALWAHKRGDGGPSMPLRAFAIASLILGAGVCVVGGVLHESGIREVKDLVNLGQKIRLSLGKPSRTQS